MIDRALAILSASAAPSGTALILDAHLGPERLSMLVPLLEACRDQLPVLAVEDESGLHRKPALAALDREESRSAIQASEGTLRRAAALGARYVVVRLGWVEGARRDWLHARDRFLKSAIGPELARGLLLARDKVAYAQVDRARAALDRLGRLAESVGVGLLVKNGQRYVELPSTHELDELRADLRGAPLAPLFDQPAAHLTDVMRLYPLALTEAAFGDGPLVYGGDACGAIAALPLGTGELGAKKVREILGRRDEATIRCFRPWPALSDEEIARGLQSLVG